MSKGISGDLLFASENIIFRRNEFGRYSLVFLTGFSDKHDSFYERNAFETTVKGKSSVENKSPVLFTSILWYKKRMVLLRLQHR